MNETLTVEVTTQLFGLGAGRATPPTFVELTERVLTARALIAEHVRAEVEQAQLRRGSSLALHYMLADNLGQQPSPSAKSTSLDVEAEIRRAWKGLAERRYMLVVDGVAIDDLDAPLSLTERSHVSFVRLLPLVGG